MKIPVLTGVYLLKHIPTGKCLVGSTSDLHKQQRYQYMLLKNGKHKSPECQKLWDTSKPDDFSFNIEVCESKEQAKLIARNRLAEYRDNGLSLNSERLHYDEPNIGVYRIVFPDGKYYIGSSKKIRERLAHHKWALTNGKSNHVLLTEAFKQNGGNYTTDIIPIQNGDPKDYEQKLLDQHIGDKDCLNFATNAKSAIADLWNNPEYRERIINGGIKRRSTPEARKAYGEKMKAYWATPEAKAKRKGGGNPFARKVSVNGIVYGSIMDAVRAKAMPDSKLRKALKDEDNKEVFYLS